MQRSPPPPPILLFLLKNNKDHQNGCHTAQKRAQDRTAINSTLCFPVSNWLPSCMQHGLVVLELPSACGSLRACTARTSGSFALTSAPWSSRDCAVSVLPSSAAMCSAVLPYKIAQAVMTLQLKNMIPGTMYLPVVVFLGVMLRAICKNMQYILL